MDARRRRLIGSGHTRRDGQLLGQMARGDRKALATIYDRHAGAAYALADRMCGAARAEDVVQEAFLLLWREARAGNQTGPARVRLLGLTRQCAVERLDGTNPASARAASTRQIDPAILALYERSALPALEAVAPLERRCIELAYFDGLNLEEIADRCQLAPAAVTEHLTGGLHHMLRLMTAGPPATPARG